MAEFSVIVKQLVEVYERDLGALRRELEHCKAINSGHTIATGVFGASEAPRYSSSQRAGLPQSCSELSRDDGPGAFNAEVEPPRSQQVGQGATTSEEMKVSLNRVLGKELKAIEVAQRPSRLDHGTSTLGGNLKIRQAEKSDIEKYLLGPLESVIGFIIMFNVVMTIVQLQVRGTQLGRWLVSQSGSDFVASSQDDHIFLVFEHIFNVIFMLELIIRIAILRCKFLRGEVRDIQWFNIFDAIIVVFCSFDLYLTPLTSGEQSPMNLTFARILRLARLARTLKVIQVLRAFSKLRILVKTVTASILSFAWSMAILGVLNLGGAIFICQMLQPVIADESLAYDLRLWLNRHYGTSAKATWTMFEFTFSGGWPTYARPVVEGVHWLYSIFFALYASIVVFAVIRIITALFLKDTLNVANKDAEFMVQESMKNKREYAMKLKELFMIADSSGNGMIDVYELQDLCSIPEVKHYFHILDLEFSEVSALFDMLDSGTGQVTFDEFVKGIIRLKGTARSMDVLSLMRSCEKIEGKVAAVEKTVSQMRSGDERPASKTFTVVNC